MREARSPRFRAVAECHTEGEIDARCSITSYTRSPLVGSALLAVGLALERLEYDASAPQVRSQLHRLLGRACATRLVLIASVLAGNPSRNITAASKRDMADDNVCLATSQCTAIDPEYDPPTAT